MRYLALIFAFTAVVTLSACGPDTTLDSDPELDYYLKLYLRWAPSNGHLDELTKLKFGSTGTDAVAACTKQKVGSGKFFTWNREIVVKRIDVDSRLAALVMHELGHCLHDKKHSEDPKSLMHSKIYWDADYWDQHLEEQVEGMFQ